MSSNALCPPPRRIDRSRPRARLARPAWPSFEREKLIVEYLNRGVSIPEIAAQMGVGEKHLRALIREILARRMPAPPAEFLAMQVSRLNEALLVAYSAMSGMNLKAVDRVVKIVRELDRYHGFAAAERRFRVASRLEAPEPGSLLEAFLAGRLQLAPQTLEALGSGPADGAAVEASEAPDAVAGRRDEAFPPRLPSRAPLAPATSAIGGLEMLLQSLEKIEFGPEDPPTRKTSAPQDGEAKRDGDFASALAAPAEDSPRAPSGRPGNCAASD
jgi:transposase-like protein